MMLIMNLIYAMQRWDNCIDAGIRDVRGGYMKKEAVFISFWDFAYHAL